MTHQAANNSTEFWQTIRQKIEQQRTASTIKPVTHLQDLPLSFTQERLWCLIQAQPNNLVYNIPSAYNLDFPLNLPALENSLNEIARRHAVLRTTFPIKNGQPIQVIPSNFSLKLPIVDFSSFNAKQQQRKLQRIIEKEAQKPFDLSRENGWRVKLVRFSDEKHVLISTVHHIVFDGVSGSIFAKELNTLYPAFSQGKASPLEENTIQYADFAYWQRQWLESSAGKAVEEYWQQQLSGQIEALQLPIDYSRSNIFDYQGASQSLQLSPQLTQALKSLSQQTGTTLFSCLLVAFKTLLHQYTGQEDITLVSPMAGRSHPETQQLIGYFNNLVVLRTNLSGNPTFRELLEQVNQVTLEAYKHEDMPLDKITQFPHLRRISLTRGMFSLSNYQHQAIKLEGKKITGVGVPQTTSNFDLALRMYDSGKVITGVLQYKTALFKPETIAKFQEHFLKLLESLVENPEQNIVRKWHDTSQQTLKIGASHDTPRKAAQLETLLREHPIIEEAIVIEREDIKRLVAYVVVLEKIPKTQLQNFLQEKSPNLNVPVTFFMLKHLPLNPEGEIDYCALTSFPLTAAGQININGIPVSEWQLSENQEKWFFPHNLTQEMLAQIWAEVLDLNSYHKGISRLNILSNFFELGGHSLGAARLFTRIQEVFQVFLPVHHLFATPTIAALAEKIDIERQQQGEKESESFLLPLQLGGSKRPLYLIPGGAGNENTLMFYAQMIFLLGQDQPVYGLCNSRDEGGGWLGEQGFHTCVESLATDYIQAIRTIQPNGSYIIAGECIGGVIAFEVAQQLREQGEAVHLILMDTLCPAGEQKIYNTPLTDSDLEFIKREALTQTAAQRKQEIPDIYTEITTRYQPQSYPGKITLLIAENRDRKSLAFNWQDFATEDWEVYESPGDHDSYLGEFIQTTAQQLKACLKAAQANDSSLLEIKNDPAMELNAVETNPTKDTQSYPVFRPFATYQTLWESLYEIERLEVICQTAISQQPHKSHFYTAAANIYSQQGDLETAISYNQKAIELDPTNAGFYRNLGNIFNRKKQTELAQSAYQRAVELQPEVPHNSWFLGRFYRQQDDLESAITCYHNTLNVMPAHFAKSRNQGFNPDERMKAEQTANEKEAQLTFQVYIELGKVYQKQEKLETAFNYYQQASQININLLSSQHWGLYVALGNAQRKQGNIEEAISSYYKAIQLNDQQAEIYVQIGNTFNQQGELEAAISNYQKAIEFNPEHLNVYIQLANVQRKQGNLETAITNYQKAIELNPNPGEAYVQLGNTLNQQGNLDEAISNYQTALQLQPKRSGVYIQLANIQRKQGNLDAAITHYQKALELNPQKPAMVYKSLGDTFSQLQNTNQAIRAYQKCLKLQPKNPEVRRCLQQLKAKNSTN